MRKEHTRGQTNGCCPGRGVLVLLLGQNLYPCQGLEGRAHENIKTKVTRVNCRRRRLQQLSTLSEGRRLAIMTHLGHRKSTGFLIWPSWFVAPVLSVAVADGFGATGNRHC